MSLRQRLGVFCVRLAVIMIGAGVLMAVPEPQTDDVLRYKNAVVVLVSVILAGKLLFDTLFYDRYGR